MPTEEHKRVIFGNRCSSRLPHWVIQSGGGRRWWGHLAFSRIDTQPTFLKKNVQELHCRQRQESDVLRRGSSCQKLLNRWLIREFIALKSSWTDAPEVKGSALSDAQMSSALRPSRVRTACDQFSQFCKLFAINPSS